MLNFRIQFVGAKLLESDGNIVIVKIVHSLSLPIFECHSEGSHVDASSIYIYTIIYF
jgi:hypothetical protein